MRIFKIMLVITLICIICNTCGAQTNSKTETSVSESNGHLQPKENIVKSTFSVNDGYDCTEIPKFDAQINITIKGDFRIITSNSIPNHAVAPFPNPGNPHTISEVNKEYRVPLNPRKASKMTSVYRGDGFGIGGPAVDFGIAINGIRMEPSAAEAFTNKETKERNFEWTKEALSTQLDLGDDCNNAHVQPTGEYHYHGTPWGLIGEADGSKMRLIAWAADGFPVYYKWGYKIPIDASSPLIELSPGYLLRSGMRPGDGISAPDGPNDGTYVRDYQYIKTEGNLDEANGRFGVTPEFPEGTYYYVITDDFPSIPRYLVGEPSADFVKRGGAMSGRERKRPGIGNQRQHPDALELLKMMDRDNDGKLSRKEVRGPLDDHFDSIDVNNDNFLQKKEIDKARPSRRD